MRIVLGVGFVSLIIATIDLMVQGRKYDFDIQSLKYLSALGWVFFITFLLSFVWILVSVVNAVFKQITK